MGAGLLVELDALLEAPPPLALDFFFLMALEIASIQPCLISSVSAKIT